MYLLVADDLTGGNDAGIQFVKHGLETWLALSPECAASGASFIKPGAKPGANACEGMPPTMFVVNTNTRNMPKDAAAKNVTDLVSALVGASSAPHPEMVFKKIDSTLRGNLGAETDALMRELSFEAAFLSPAFPAQERVVKNGLLYVNGVPVHETGFAKDPLTPISQSRVSDIVGSQSGRVIGEVPISIVEKGAEAIARAVAAMLRDGVEIFVFDAETAEHLAFIAAAGFMMRKKPLFIGSAGLAEALAQAMPGFGACRNATDGTARQYASKGIEHVLYVCGSAHQATRAQVDALAKAGVPVVPFTGFLTGQSPEHERRAIVDALAAALREGDVVLASPAANGEHTAGNTLDGMALSDSIGEAALAAVKLSGLDAASLALVMTGGETAYAVLKEICTGLALERELFPGIALCRVVGGEWDSLHVITKAGGFGDSETLVEVLRLLRPENVGGCRE
ncbi:MAG: D-threonate kinase [Desulfovibrio sp.]